ncbi:ATP-binding cassette subfamily C member 4 [Pseudolycoriella hygida]|uniref:ATP-binding cassette subfamily C member 4 n=1 Tax=Pseudolycoriella hygida TaxID=35572 RepID=A0A9Q0NCT7_9DIPT|nr:ATP-binding cassette subfamily C member 4 [Pseudolycoriella hygida]
MAVICFVNDVVIRLTLPILLGNLLNYYRKDGNMTYEDAVNYGIAIVAISVLLGLIQVHYYFNGSHYGMNIRTAICSLIYGKVLKLSKIALGDPTSGNVLNLLSNDVNRFDSVITVLHSLWTAPLVAFICGYLLWQEIQWCGMIGMAIIFMTVPFQSYAGRLSSKYRNATATRTDERIRFMDEIISGIQVIKMYAWELSFANLTEIIRGKELKIVLKNAYVRAMYMSLSLFTSRIALCASVVSVFLLYDRENLTVAKMFVVSALFNAVSSGMCETFILAVAHTAETMITFRRLEAFLNLNEKCVSSNFDAKKCGQNDISISLNDVTARWTPIKTESDNSINKMNLTLDRVSVQIPKGKLIGVIGPVGAGKSSFLQALIQELPLESGFIRIEGSISYASQEPWIFTATVRQNILFGQKIDMKRYDAVVKCTDLLKDFEQFSEGDKTIVNESGLSGGQKARINLARAVYRDADIYLFDDPLSAVDGHVGLHTFNECIGPQGFLAKSTRILVTHQVHFLQQADWVLVLRDGKIDVQGTYNEILSSCSDFAISHFSQSDFLNGNDFNKSDTIESRKETNSGVTSSTTKQTTVRKSIENVPSELESSSKGMIKGSLLFRYFCSANQPMLLGVLVVLFFMAQIFASAADVWVAIWTRKEEVRTMNYVQICDNLLRCSNHTSNSGDNEDAGIPSTSTYAYIYGGIIIALFVTGISRSIMLSRLCVTVSQNLHDQMFQCVINATMRFFNTNPSGRILNRFSNDIGIIDEILPKTFLDAAQTIVRMFGALFVIMLNVNTIFVAVLVAMIIAFTFLCKIYLKTSQDIKRLEGMTKSPVFTHISASIAGLPTIRTFNAERMLQREFDSHQDLHISCIYMYIATGAAFAMSLEIIVHLFVISVTIYFLFFNTDATGDKVGLAISQSLTLTALFKYGIRKSTDVANQLMSVERVLEYSSCIAAEKHPDIPIEAPSQWPQLGKIEFQNVCYRYLTAAEPVLRDLSFVIGSKEKIGIVGRTGSGKSSLIASLFRLACADGIDGKILIDDIDTAQLNLKDLRSKIAIIPQDPVLFSGTLRRNLDPFDEYSDADIWTALENVELKETACNTLEAQVMAKGSNFSVGQRQLLCLARAILRRNSILVLDEATANVDPHTDFLIQQTIRTKFVDCTVLTVAHRLNTIIDSDRVLVMDGGVAVEYDAPFKLLSKANGVFKGMVEALGSHEFNRLLSMSQKEKTDRM